jgi:hypothetical protein
VGCLVAGRARAGREVVGCAGIHFSFFKELEMALYFIF